MRTLLPLLGKLLCLSLVFWLGNNVFAADSLLMTLLVESSKIRWQEEFILTLEIYGAPSGNPPDVSVEGLDQFQLNGQGKNLLQIPGGKTVKWILTYSLTAAREGTFQLGPAKALLGGRRYASNTLFITVEAPKRKPGAITVPMVRSAAEIGDKILILMETEKKELYRNEGVGITLRLLSQLPIESLRFRKEADFPGFLKYDFPFSQRPQAKRIAYRGSMYAAFELQRFLVFPIKEGPLAIPPVTCDLTVRVPSGTFAAADLMLETERTSNSLLLQARPLPVFALVGNFSLQNAIVSDAPRAKIIRLTLEGDGQLSTFDFPEFTSPDFEARTLASSVTASVHRTLKSRKVTELEITPRGDATSIVLPELSLTQLEPSSGHLSTLRLPPLSLHFSPQPAESEPPAPLPDLKDPISGVIFLVFLSSSTFFSIRLFRPPTKTAIPRFHTLFRGKKPELQISKNAAQKLYEQITQRVAENDGSETSLIETLKKHVPQQERLILEGVFRKLEWNAFSQAKAIPLTYGEVKEICSRLERRWQS